MLVGSRELANQSAEAARRLSSLKNALLGSYGWASSTVFDEAYIVGGGGFERFHRCGMTCGPCRSVFERRGIARLEWKDEIPFCGSV